MPTGSNSETISNPSYPGRGAIGYCRAEPGIERVSELYPEAILRDPVESYEFLEIHR